MTRLSENIFTAMHRHFLSRKMDILGKILKKVKISKNLDFIIGVARKHFFAFAVKNEYISFLFFTNFLRFI